MSNKLIPVLAALAVLAFACQKDKKDDQVVSQKYVHKYGYAVSKEEWAAKNYPGQVISSLRNGVTVTATYENGELHGPCTFTYPNSQVVEKYVLYNQNTPVKEILYDISGMPVQETVQLSQHRHSLTQWYSDGVPRSVEEYTDEELIEGQYFTLNNELESHVEKGKGQRILRDNAGGLLCKDDIEAGYTVKRESFYPNGSPESIAYYHQNKLNGERRTFTAAGEPLAIEEWINGQLHGKSTYFKNGTKYREVSYLFGKKNGWETQFMDGEGVAHRTAWENDLKHGPETFYVADGEKIVWHYCGKEVSQSKFEEMNKLDEMISQVSPENAIER
jgi:antitoxin component YwqK of YwqJK toxin-antitoxin module